MTCSDEFSDVKLNLEAIDADTSVVNGRLDELEEAIGRLDNLEEAVAEIEQWRETVSAFSAQGVQGLADSTKPIGEVGSHGGLASPENKDTIIEALVVANVLLIIGCFVAAFTACGTQNKVGYGKVYPEN